MKKNNSFQEIGQQLMQAETVLIYPHVNMDGDALGSAAALCKALRKWGKTCYILLEDNIARNIQFLDKGYCTWDKDLVADVDVSVCLDCGDLSRFQQRKDKFLEGKVTICLDHHRTTEPFCQFNYVDPDAAATGLLVFQLLKTMGAEPDAEIADAIFAAITTDTGDFQYSNTTKECHEVMTELFDWGVNVSAVSQEIYNRVRLERILLHGKALDRMEVLCDGMVAMTVVTQKMLEETGAGMDETEGLVEQLRSIDGVEIAILVKEAEPEKLKASLRAKSWGNVADIAEKLGGGGHIKAAGCTINMGLEDGLALLRQEVEQVLKEECK